MIGEQSDVFGDDADTDVFPEVVAKELTLVCLW